jgi:hypothetical protein
VVDRKEESSVSNDVIEALLRRLSPRAREVYDEIEKLDERASREGTSPEEVAAQAAALLDGLTVSDRTDLLRILEAQNADVEHQGRKPGAGRKKRAELRRLCSALKTSIVREASPSTTP